MPWLVRQPDDVVSSMQAQINNIGLEYTIGHKFAYDPWGGMLIKTNLNGALDKLCPIMRAEAAAAVRDTFTQTDQWKEVDLFPACRVLIGRVTLAFTLGDSAEGRKLCHDAEFLASCYAVLDGMLDTAGSLAASRPVLRPISGRWAARAMNGKLSDLARRFQPVYYERLAIINQKAAGEKVAEPQDLLQMLMTYAAAHRPQELQSLHDMTRRLAVNNFGTMHQSVLTAHNLLLDIIGTDQQHETVSKLRDELSHASLSPLATEKENDNMPQHNGTQEWSRAKAAALVLLDSCARETQRVHSFLGRGVQRLVVARDGLVTEDGIRLPRGAMVSVLTHQAQTDPDRWDGAGETYDPFRFARTRMAAANPTSGRPGLGHLSFASTSPDYLPFSHGRHACPGRFLVDIELKMVAAAILTNYDVDFPHEYEGKRPPNVWFAGFGIPPLEAKLRVRKRT